MKGLFSVFVDGVNSPKLDAPLGIHARFIYMHAALFLRAPGRKRQGELGRGRGRRRRRRRRVVAVGVKKVGEDLELGKMRTRSTTKPTSPTPDRPTTPSCPL